MNKNTILLIIAVFLAGGFFIGRSSIPNLLPFVILLLCPLIMIFMMKDNHKHK